MSFELVPADYEDAMKMDGKDLTGWIVEVKKTKRSEKANRYLWVLCNEIADKAMMTSREVYKRAVRDAGLYDDLYMKEEALETFRRNWERQGIAYMVENDPPKNGKVLVRVYYGSSGYSNTDFKKLLDFVIDDARFYGIETITQTEIDHMMALREKEYGNG